MKERTPSANNGSGWINFQHRGVLVSSGAVSAFIADRWRVGGGIRGLRNFAGTLRRGSRVAVRDVIPRHVLKLWVAAGYPDCWINYRPDGMSCLIIVPGDRVIRVPRIDSPAMRRQFAAAAEIQAEFGDLAPRIIEVGASGSHAAEAYFQLTGAKTDSGDIETVFRHMTAITPGQAISVSEVIGMMTAGLNLPVDLARAATDLVKSDGASSIPWRAVHGDLVLHNVWRQENGDLVAIDWEFAREGPASYDLWHLNLMPWIRGEISLDKWLAVFSEQLGRCLPEEASRVELHHQLNVLSTAVFFASTGYGDWVAEKTNALRELLVDRPKTASDDVFQTAQERQLI